MMHDLKEKKVYYEEVSHIWLNSFNKNISKVVERNYYVYNHKRYNICNNRSVVLEYSDEEYKCALWLAKVFGGIVYINPKINYPKGIMSSDYIWHGERWDLKCLRNVSSNLRAVDNSIKNCKNQSRNFILDITNIKIDDNLIIKQVINVFTPGNFNRSFVNKIIVKKGDILIGVYVKKRLTNRPSGQ